MLRLRRETNPGPPALQANTLRKEPFERRILLPFGISACAFFSPQKVELKIPFLRQAEIARPRHMALGCCQDLDPPRFGPLDPDPH
jgi:hypothetical protein